MYELTFSFGSLRGWVQDWTPCSRLLKQVWGRGRYVHRTAVVLEHDWMGGVCVYMCVCCLPGRRFRKQDFSLGIAKLKEGASGADVGVSVIGGGVVGGERGWKSTVSLEENLIIFNLRNLIHMNSFFIECGPFQSDLSVPSSWYFKYVHLHLNELLQDNLIMR